MLLMTVIVPLSLIITEAYSQTGSTCLNDFGVYVSLLTQYIYHNVWVLMVLHWDP
jgi:hypothetical protein